VAVVLPAASDVALVAVTLTKDLSLAAAYTDAVNTFYGRGEIPIGAIRGRRHLEYNVVQDIPAAKWLAERWPTPIVWSGFEIGEAIQYPAVSIERDYGYVSHHPLVDSYVAYEPPPHCRPTWDLTSVLHAIRAGS